MNIAQAIALSSSAVSTAVALLSHRIGSAPGWQAQRWFSLVALTAACYTVLNLFSVVRLAPSVTLAIYGGQGLFIGLHALGWLRYSRAYVGQKGTRLDWLVILVMAAVGVASALVPTVLFTGVIRPRVVAPLGLTYYDCDTTLLGTAYLATSCACLAWTGARFARAWRRKVPHAAVHCLGMGVLLATAVNDLLAIQRVITSPLIADLGFLASVGAVGYALTARFVAGARALEQMSTRQEATIKERTAELAHAQTALLRADKLAALGQLVAGVAHEVNNPTSAIAANLQYLIAEVGEKGELPRDGLQCLRESQISTDRIAQLVRQFVDTGRLASSPPAITGSASLREITRQAVRLARARCGHGIEIREDVPEDLWCRCEEQALVQALANLVINALQAIPEQSTTGQVVVAGARRGDRIELTVEDNGTGMSADTLGRLFEPFFTTKPFGKGSGLGLAVSRGLILGMGGDLRLSSTVGVGTRASIEISASAPPAVSVPEPPPPQRRMRRLLVVDDDRDVREALARRLARGYEVTTAKGVRSALELIQSETAFNLILCDLMMDEGGGAHVYEVLRERFPALAGKLIFLTGGPTSKEARAFLSGQPQPVLIKPLEVRDLDKLAEKLAGPGELVSAPRPAAQEQQRSVRHRRS